MSEKRYLPVCVIGSPGKETPEVLLGEHLRQVRDQGGEKATWPGSRTLYTPAHSGLGASGTACCGQAQAPDCDGQGAGPSAHPVPLMQEETQV